MGYGVYMGSRDGRKARDRRKPREYRGGEVTIGRGHHRYARFGPSWVGAYMGLPAKSLGVDRVVPPRGSPVAYETPGLFFRGFRGQGGNGLACTPPVTFSDQQARG